MPEPPLLEAVEEALKDLVQYERQNQAQQKTIGAIQEARLRVQGTEALRSRLRREGIPKVVTLCGSTRFMDAFFDEGWRLTIEGVIVLSVGVCKHAGHHGAEALGQDVADRLDELHLRKIDLSDEILVLNLGGYIGEREDPVWSTITPVAPLLPWHRPLTWLRGAPASSRDPPEGLLPVVSIPKRITLWRTLVKSFLGISLE